MIDSRTVTFIVPAVLGGLALVVMLLVALGASRKGKHPAASHQQYNAAQPRILVHSINKDRCTGCDACVAVCPTNVLDLVDNKSTVISFQDCIQCEACMWACPTTALVMHLEGTEPPPIKAPQLDENFQTAVPGQYLIGEVSGKPLVKNAANLGRMVVEHMLRSGLQSLGAGATATRVDVAIVGSGPGGLSAALTCIQRGLSYVVLEKEQMVASTISRYPKGKFVMAEPYDVKNYSLLPVYDSSKEQLVACWEDLIQKTNLQIQKGHAVEEIQRGPDGMFNVRTTTASFQAQRVVLATGTRGKPRTLGVPGENLPKVHTLLEDPDDFRGMPVIVTGGGDSAVEAAMALADAGAKVVLAYRGRAFNRCAPKNRQAIESYDAQRKVKVRYQSNIVQFTEDKVIIQMADNTQKTYPNQAAFILIGADPPIKWLQKVGVNFIERPHSHQLGKTDDLVQRFLGAETMECPQEANVAAELVLHGRVVSQQPGAYQQQQQPQAQAQAYEDSDASKPRKWLRSATAMFGAVAFGRSSQPEIPLSEFARNQRRHNGTGRRDALPAAERTRILRMLRDEGASIAYDESRVDIRAVPDLDGPDYDLDTPPPNFHQPSPLHAAEPHEATVMAGGIPPRPPAPGYARSDQGYGGYQNPPPMSPPRMQAGPPPVPRMGAPAPALGGGYADEYGHEEATRAVDVEALGLDMMGHDDDLDEATRIGGGLGADLFEEPTRAAFPGAFGGLDDYADHDEATRAVDMEDLARLDPRYQGGGQATGGRAGGYQVPPSSFDEEATRAVDLSNYDQGRPDSLSDVDWDLD